MSVPTAGNELICRFRPAPDAIRPSRSDKAFPELNPRLSTAYPLPSALDLQGWYLLRSQYTAGMQVRPLPSIQLAGLVLLYRSLSGKQHHNTGIPAQHSQALPEGS